jgi:phosphate:Na+ symporter
MTNLEIVFQIIGGIAILLYGIHLSGVSLQKMLGFRLEEILKKTDENPVKGLAIGTGITSLIQSSGTTIIMLIGFISAGLLTLKGAVPVMLGANIGSTITVQLASFRLGLYALPILTAGVFIHIFCIRKIYKNFGEALIGFSFLFLGMNFIFTGTQSLSSNETAVVFFDVIGSSVILSIFIAAFFTVLLRSSSAITVLIVALGVSQIVELKQALFLIFGANLGSSFKIIYLTLTGRGFFGRIASLSLLFNCSGIFISLIFFKYFYYLVSATSDDIGRQIANAHTLYNIIAALVFVPFVPFILKLMNKYAPIKKVKNKELFYLNRKLLYTPSVALNQVNRAVVEMARISYEMLENSRLMFFEDKVRLFKKVEKDENKIDTMTEKISEYTTQISQQNLTKKDAMRLYSSMHILTDIEHLSDHILAISELIVNLKKENIKFSNKAVCELTAIFGKLKIMQNLVIKSLEEDNLQLAHEIIKHENKVDEIVKKAHDNHLERIDKRMCPLQNGKYFVELLNNLERIGDHYDNIAYAVVDRFRYK